MSIEQKVPARARARTKGRPASAMASTEKDVTPHVFDERGAGRYLGVSAASLRLWRATGGGPPYFKPGAGKLIRYRKSDLDSWIEGRLKK